MLISDSYKQLNAQLHATNAEYGTSGGQRAGELAAIADKFGCASILDYGCGKGDLKRALMLRDVREYDPAIPGKDTMPEPADLVFCGDVLEHVEPEHLVAVMDHLWQLAKKIFVCVVHTGAARKFLADGRNAHLTQQSVEWWLPQLMERWTFIKAADGDNGFFFVGSRKCDTYS